MKQKAIFFFGDSIFVGQGHSIYNGWITRLAKSIEGSKEKYLVINSSVNGRTSRQALEDMPYATNNLNIDSIIIQFGLNDCNHWVTDHGLPRVSPEAFQANILEIVSRAKAMGIKKIIVNNNHPTNVGVLRNLNIDYDDWSRKYNQLIRDIYQNSKNDIYFNDIEKKINKSMVKNNYLIKDLLMDDGLHLSATGHDLYYEIQKEFLEKII